MSVYTSVPRERLVAWLATFPVGKLLSQEPIAAGIENTNYFVTTSTGRYVLTLYERLSFDMLPFYIGLMAHLADRGVACPHPIADHAGALFKGLEGKPAGLVTRLNGRSHLAPAAEHCRRVGEELARMHLAGRDFSLKLDDPRGEPWRQMAAAAVAPFLTVAQKELLLAEVALHSDRESLDLPKGAIHGDLFRDNVLFSDNKLEGIIDFGFAATAGFAYDVAIAVNDWCIELEGTQRGKLVVERVDALLQGYTRMRPFTPLEAESWPYLLRLAALRFWLSRLYDWHLPRPGELVHAHDPTHFEVLLRDRIAVMPAFPGNASR